MVSSPGLLALFRIVQAGPPQPNGRAGHRIQKAKRQFNSPLRVQRSEVATMPRPDWLALFRMRKTGARKAPHHSASKRRNQRPAQSCDFVRALPCGDSPLVEVAHFLFGEIFDYRAGKTLTGRSFAPETITIPRKRLPPHDVSPVSTRPAIVSNFQVFFDTLTPGRTIPRKSRRGPRG